MPTLKVRFFWVSVETLKITERFCMMNIIPLQGITVVFYNAVVFTDNFLSVGEKKIVIILFLTH